MADKHQIVRPARAARFGGSDERAIRAPYIAARMRQQLAQAA